MEIKNVESFKCKKGVYVTLSNGETIGVTLASLIKERLNKKPLK